MCLGRDETATGFSLWNFTFDLEKVAKEESRTPRGGSAFCLSMRS